MDSIKDLVWNEMGSAVKAKDAKPQEFSFLLSRFLRMKFKELSAAANPTGGRVVRWTDLLERGVSKLTADDLKEIYESRKKQLERA